MTLTVDGESFALFGADQMVELRVREGRLEIVDVLHGDVFAHYELDKEGKPIVPAPRAGIVAGLACPRCAGPVAEDTVGATVHGGYVCLSDDCSMRGIMRGEVTRLG